MHDRERGVDPSTAAGAGPRAEPPGQPLVGARFHAAPRPASPSPPVPRDRPGQRFDAALRGYDRRQVDAHLDAQEAEQARLRAEVEELRRRWQASQEHSAILQSELRQLRHRVVTAQPPAPVESGSRPVADRVLRLARYEAAKIRATAIRESTALLDRARTEAASSRRAEEDPQPGSDPPPVERVWADPREIAP
jgi:hypothetical protein